MITIVAKFVIKKECIEQFKKLAWELVVGSRNEAGNVSYNLYQDRSNPGILTFIEEWKDEAAIDFHNATEHFTSAIAAMEPLEEAAPEINQYDQLS
jgi:quinol monooxygenase YgiN